MATEPEMSTLDFAHFANGEGITSDVVLVNVGTTPIRPAIYFYDTQGDPIDAASVVDILGDLEATDDDGLTVRTAMEPLGELTVSTHGRGPQVSGSVKVVSNAPIGGGLRFDFPDIGEAVVGAGPPISDALFPVRRREGGINTGVAVHNWEEGPLEVSCRLMSGGDVLEEIEIPLEANGQTSWLIDTAFPGVDMSDFAGSVRCDAVGEGLFTAVALEADAGTRIFTTLPVFPVDRGGGGGPGLCAFRQWDRHHFRSGVREYEDRAERSRAHPLSYGHPSEPSRYLFLRHAGKPDCRRLGGGCDGRSGDRGGRRSDGADPDVAAGSAHDSDPRWRGAGERIGKGALGGSHRRDAAL